MHGPERRWTHSERVRPVDSRLHVLTVVEVEIVQTLGQRPELHVELSGEGTEKFHAV